jgi:peptidoglycan glycosyltransferase
MHDMAFRFGFNQPVAWNISRQELLKGITVFPSSFPATENEHELAWSCIGQEKVLATPFQLALVASAIANNGILMKPKLELNEAPQIWKQVTSEAVARKVQKMMREVVWGKGGTAYRMQMKEVEVAGKTGTSEITRVITKEDSSTEKIIINNALFISFAPVDNPQIAIAVVAEGAGYGGAAAAPIAKEIYLKAHQLGYFKNDTIKHITKQE